MSHAEGGDDVVNELAGRTKGFSGADLMNVCREAGMIALRDRHREKKKMQNGDAVGGGGGEGRGVGGGGGGGVDEARVTREQLMRALECVRGKSLGLSNPV